MIRFQFHYICLLQASNGGMGLGDTVGDLELWKNPPNDLKQWTWHTYAHTHMHEPSQIHWKAMIHSQSYSYSMAWEETGHSLSQTRRTLTTCNLCRVCPRIILMNCQNKEEGNKKNVRACVRLPVHAGMYKKNKKIKLKFGVLLRGESCWSVWDAHFVTAWQISSARHSRHMGGRLYRL